MIILFLLGQSHFLCWPLRFFHWVCVCVCVCGCAGSSLLCVGFLQLQRVGSTFQLRKQTDFYGQVSRSSDFSQWWAQLLCGTWDLPRPGIEPVSPALAGRFLTTGPLGKSQPPNCDSVKPMSFGGAKETFLEISPVDFPGGPVVKTLSFHFLGENRAAQPKKKEKSFSIDFSPFKACSPTLVLPDSSHQKVQSVRSP